MARGRGRPSVRMLGREEEEVLVVVEEEVVEVAVSDVPVDCLESLRAIFPFFLICRV